MGRLKKIYKDLNFEKIKIFFYFVFDKVEGYLNISPDGKVVWYNERNELEPVRFWHQMSRQPHIRNFHVGGRFSFRFSWRASISLLKKRLFWHDAIISVLCNWDSYPRNLEELQNGIWVQIFIEKFLKLKEWVNNNQLQYLIVYFMLLQSKYFE